MLSSRKNELNARGSFFQITCGNCGFLQIFVCASWPPLDIKSLIAIPTKVRHLLVSAPWLLDALTYECRYKIYRVLRALTESIRVAPGQYRNWLGPLMFFRPADTVAFGKDPTGPMSTIRWTWSLVTPECDCSMSETRCGIGAIWSHLEMWSCRFALIVPLSRWGWNVHHERLLVEV